MKLLKCKTSINKILFSVEKLFVTMFVIFSLVRKIINFNFKTNNQLISNTQFVRIDKGEPVVFKISRTSILRTSLYIYINTFPRHINFRGKEKR
jgi:hypothetical protein